MILRVGLNCKPKLKILGLRVVVVEVSWNHDILKLLRWVYVLYWIIRFCDQVEWLYYYNLVYWLLINRELKL